MNVDDALFLIAENTTMKNAGISESMNALPIRLICCGRNGSIENPVTTASDIPKLAPADIPVMYGSASGFFIILCIAAPQTPNPAPMAKVANVRGTYMFHTT